MRDTAVVESTRNLARRIMRVAEEQGYGSVRAPMIDRNPEATIDLVWLSQDRKKLLGLSIEVNEDNSQSVWCRWIEGRRGYDLDDPTDSQLAALLAWFLMA